MEVYRLPIEVLMSDKLFILLVLGGAFLSN